MATQSFMSQFAAMQAVKRHVCVGLDITLEMIKNRNGGGSLADRLTRFAQHIVNETKGLAGYYKPNFAFWLEFGVEGLKALEWTVAHIRAHTDAIVILDAKVGDIATSNNGFVSYFLKGGLQADAITVSPYLGKEALQPFLDQRDKGVFILCKTSNPGSKEFQNNCCYGSMPLYQYLAHRVPEFWNANGNCGLVVGATYPDELAVVRKGASALPLLIPGIGKQGGDLEKTIAAAKGNFIINVSRNVLESDKPGLVVEQLHQSILEYRATTT